MFQWTDGEVSHVVKLALESVRSSALYPPRSHCSKLIEALAGELAASAWHAHTIDSQAIGRRRALPWQTIAADRGQDWSEFCPFDFYAADLERMLVAAQECGTATDEVARRTCHLALANPLYITEQRVSVADQLVDMPVEHYVLAWLAIQPEGTCACVEFLKRTSAGPFSLRDEALVRILSTELLAEPAGAAAQPDVPELAEMAELPRRQREVLTRLLAGSSVKEIAIDLGISPYTVNDYIKALYRRYQVSSRGELMAAMHGLRRPAVPK